MAGNERNPCLPGRGCQPVIDAQAKIESAVTAFNQHILEQRKAHDDHVMQSTAFWEAQKEIIGVAANKIEKISEDMRDAALKFNDGAHRFSKNEDDIQAAFDLHREHSKTKDGDTQSHREVERQFSRVYVVVGVSVTFSGIALGMVMKYHGEGAIASLVRVLSGIF